MRHCRSSDNEGKAAIRRAARLIQELRPTTWRWVPGTRTVMIPYEQYRQRNVAGAAEGQLKEVLFVTADRIVEWHLLAKGRMAIVQGSWLVILPADSAEPLW